MITKVYRNQNVTCQQSSFSCLIWKFLLAVSNRFCFRHHKSTQLGKENLKKMFLEGSSVLRFLLHIYFGFFFFNQKKIFMSLCWISLSLQSMRNWSRLLRVEPGPRPSSTPSLLFQSRVIGHHLCSTQPQFTSSGI